MARLTVVVGYLSFAAIFVVSVSTDNGEAGLRLGNGIYRGELNHDNLAGDLVGALSSKITNSICSLIGPNFLQVILATHKCPPKFKLPNTFQSHKDFCAFYNCACPGVKRCLTNAAVHIEADLPGIFRGNLVIAKCCKQCDSNPKGTGALSGELGDGLLSGELLSNNLVTDSVSDLGGRVNDLVCSVLGPDFLHILLNNNGCPSGVLLRTAFRSYECFCAFYNRAPPSVKKCMTDAAIQVEDRLKIDSGTSAIGECCAYCASNNKGGDSYSRPHYSLVASNFEPPKPNECAVQYTASARNNVLKIFHAFGQVTKNKRQ